MFKIKKDYVLCRHLYNISTYTYTGVFYHDPLLKHYPFVANVATNQLAVYDDGKRLQSCSYRNWLFKLYATLRGNISVKKNSEGTQLC